MITKKNLTVQGSSIAYLTIGKGDCAVIFVHGNSSCAKAWETQLNDSELAEKYQLISIDLPGHGKSDRSSDYRIKEVANIISNFIRLLQLKKYIVVAISLGTCLVAEAAPSMKGCKGFVMASPNIVNGKHKPASFLVPFAAMRAMVSATASNEDLQQFSKHLILNNPVIETQYQSSYLETDPEFRVTLGKVMATEDWSDELDNLKKTDLPVCLIFGKEDKTIKSDYLNEFIPKWRDKIFFIDNAAHFINAEQPTAFNQLLKEFAHEVFK